MILKRKYLNLIPAVQDRLVNKKDLINIFEEAYCEDKENTIRTLFYIRDGKNGIGKKYESRIMYRYILENDSDMYYNNLVHIITLGRWDDLFYTIDVITPRVIKFIKAHLNDTLLKKSLPRESVNANLARHIAKELGFTMKEYRKHCSYQPEFVNTIYKSIFDYTVSNPK